MPLGTGHSDFTVTALNSAIDPALCGSLNVVALYESSPVADSAVLTYDDASNLFTANTNDRTLIGNTKEYSLKATFADYPVTPTAV